MKISIFGLGYVGTVSAACFARDGHEVVGVDVNPTKVKVINDGRSPIVEEGLNELIAEVVQTKRLRATSDAVEAVRQTEISLVCVGTPSNDNGSLNLDFVGRVCEEIGGALAKNPTPHVVVVRSTMLPGTVDGLVKPILEASSQKNAGIEFDVCINPEFLREGTSIKDFYSPPFTLIGSDSKGVIEPLSKLYSAVNAPIYFTSVRAAEMIKYACNCFHGLKVSFANEIGNICKELSIDSHEVMDVFCRDSKLNISPYYLKPGFAFGGSCLPKDLRALQYKARELNLKVPVLNATLESNLLQIERAVQLIMKTGKKKVGFLGFAFKAGTDDLRESPVVSVIERLIGKGFDVKLYDKEVSFAKLVGANREYIEREIPHISRLMVADINSIMTDSEIVVVGNSSPEFEAARAMLSDDQIIIDLVRAFGKEVSGDKYIGICW